MSDHQYGCEWVNVWPTRVVPVVCVCVCMCFWYWLTWVVPEKMAVKRVLLPLAAWRNG